MTYRTLTLPQLGAVVAGNALEFYDFLTFSFFAVPISHAFFPAKDATQGLLLTLATFGAGFLTRPIGGALVGTLADRLGRRPAMVATFALMGFSSAGLALTPSYARIGLAAPLLVLFFRLLQGLALGGEVGPTTALLLEAAPPQRRGFFVSLQNATQYFSVLCAGLVGALLAETLPPALFTDWGWRIAMLLGVAIVPFALILRRRLPETLLETRQPVRLSRAQVRLGFVALGLLASNTISTYTMNYMTIYALHTLGLPAPAAFAATVATGLGATLGALAGGWTSDRRGRKPVMRAGLCALLAIAIPAFWLIAAHRDATLLFAASGLMAFCAGFFAPAMLTAVAESLPSGIRAGSLGFIYALAVASFGGTAQYVVTWLIAVTGSPLAPVWYLSGALVVGLMASLFVTETAPLKRG